ncbi:hypothetical protein B0J11DRAFT_441449 [Dendryphion nanum]|uniref:Rhodopsin domain-containing protein n=1 Tax=Dendryphion nanum TaxID=256645 RepID=A0A9P9IFD5_9PLEO|nr:hypothetical protein B0J11DRAFT_441449 [Dendryphion nanum]
MDQIPPEQLAILRAEDMGPTCKAIVFAFTIIAFISVFLRFYTRALLMKTVGIEDYFILASMCCSVVMAACQIMQVKWGSGKHAIFVDLKEASTILKYLYFAILAYCSSITFTKISILLQYRKIFSTRQMRWPIYIVLGICTAFGLACVISGIFTCIPVDAAWDLTKQPTAKCVKVNALYWVNASLNIFTDWLVAILPVKAVLGLQLPKRQKIVLIAILTLGWFVCIVSILRLNALIVLARHPEDSTWYSSSAAYWSSIEVNLAIVCASVPALKALVVKVIPRFASQFKSSVTGQKSKDWTVKDTRNSRITKEFIELKGQNSRLSADVDLERKGDTVTALPALEPAPGCITYQVDIEQYSERTGRTSESDSQKDLVSPYSESYVHSDRK